MEVRIVVGPDLIERVESLDCTCPCLDCIEGAHCGGVYIGDEGQFVGECHEVVDEGPADDYWPEDWDE